MRVFLATLLLAICAFALALPVPDAGVGNESPHLDKRGFFSLGANLKPVVKALGKLKGGKKGPKQALPDFKKHFGITNNGRGTTVVNYWAKGSGTR